jgi:inosose dehydratase
MSIQFGISAINWVNEDVLTIGDHYTCDQVLTDMSNLNFKGTEGCRKFPKDANELKQKLADKGMVLTSQWKSTLFSDPSRREEEMKAYKEHVDFLRAMGCTYVVTCEVANSFGDPRGMKDPSQITPLTDMEWSHLIEGLHEAGRYCRANGMHLVYHFHADTVIQTHDEIHRLVESTDPELVNLLYDTGHAYYGGSDPLEILQQYYDRILYIHVKDVRQEVLDWKRNNRAKFTDAVIKGLFTVPGDGCIDFEPIFHELTKRKYEGWIILEAEQDPTVADPVEYAEKAKAYIGKYTKI